MPTVHIEASKGEIADLVIMPGDPLRAKYIADNFLCNVFCFNKLRNNLGFTGIYQGRKVSVMGSGMGCPSIGIYSYELYNFYGVESIIRVGTAGALCGKLQLKNIVLAQGACTDSNYALQYNKYGCFAPIASYELLTLAFNQAKKMKLDFSVGNVFSSDIFYQDDKEFYRSWEKLGVLAIEMESSALYTNAAVSGKKALSILTITDHIFAASKLTSKEREQGLNDMIRLALGVSLDC